MELLKIFEDNNYEAYLVGGFVRDYILKRQSSDVDICTNATPMQIKEIFKEVKLPFESYGSVHLNYKKVDFEITTYRMDLEYKNKRNPSKIMYTDKLEIDLKRRDFTMNTLCMDSSGKIIDLFNNRQDIDNKIIKTVGDANKKLAEDSLRILRAIRFATELNFTIDDELSYAIVQNEYLLSELSFFRKKQELNRILLSSNVLYGISLLKKYNLDKYLDIQISDNFVKTSDPIGMWVQLKPSEKYQFTSNEKRYIKSIDDIINSGNIDDITLYKNGNYISLIAAQIMGIDERLIHDMYDKLPIKKISDIALKPRDIIDLLNIKDNYKIKDILNDLEGEILIGDLNNNKEDIKKYLTSKC
mgnify:FL=1